MASWLRLILSVIALAGLLAAGTGGAWAAKSHDHCASMMMVDCPSGGGDHANMPDSCAAPACAIAQPAPAPETFALAHSVFAIVSAPLPRDDDQRLGLRGPPDLRPPIA